MLINRYTISQADVINVIAEFPEATCIVTAGDWNRYTHEAKEYGLENGVGVFNVSEFLGALWSRDIVRYVRKDRSGNPTYAYGDA